MLKRTYVTLPFLGPSQATIKLLKQIHQKISTIFHEESHDQDPGSVTRMIKNLYWEQIQIRRLKIRPVLLYRIKHALVAIPTDLYLISKQQDQKATIRSINNSNRCTSLYSFSNLQSCALTTYQMRLLQHFMYHLNPSSLSWTHKPCTS